MDRSGWENESARNLEFKDGARTAGEAARYQGETLSEMSSQWGSPQRTGTALGLRGTVGGGSIDRPSSAVGASARQLPIDPLTGRRKQTAFLRKGGGRQSTVGGAGVHTPRDGGGVLSGSHTPRSGSSIPLHSLHSLQAQAGHGQGQQAVAPPSPLDVVLGRRSAEELAAEVHHDRREMGVEMSDFSPSGREARAVGRELLRAGDSGDGDGRERDGRLSAIPSVGSQYSSSFSGGESPRAGAGASSSSPRGAGASGTKKQRKIGSLGSILSAGSDGSQGAQSQGLAGLQTTVSAVDRELAALRQDMDSRGGGGAAALLGETEVSRGGRG